MNYGIQLYSIRDVAEKDFEAALRAAAEIGYTMVESAGFFGHDAATVKEWLQKYGLTLCSTHTVVKELEADLEGVLDYHETLGCRDLIIPGASFSTKEKLDTLIANINKWQPVAAARGIRMHYHNHHKEFLPNEDGQIAMDELCRRTDILFEIDTYWAFAAGKDPLALLDQYGDRVRFIHLKDGLPDHTGAALGEGAAPIFDVWKKAVATGRTIVVESEGLVPTGPEEVGRCMAYLKTLKP